LQVPIEIDSRFRTATAIVVTKDGPAMSPAGCYSPFVIVNLIIVADSVKGVPIKKRRVAGIRLSVWQSDVLTQKIFMPSGQGR